MSTPHIMSGGRYPVLRALGILYVIGAVAVLCVGGYWTVWSLIKAPGSMMERAMLALAALAATFFAVVTVLAIAELIKLMIDIERNTRASALGMAPAAANPVPSDGARTRRFDGLEEEPAEAALLRGH